MAGFASGFGAAFSRSYEQARQQSHERETDEFRYRMEDLIKRRDKYDEWKRQDSQYMEQAKQIVEVTDQDPQAVGYIYDMLKNGGTDFGDALKIAQSGTFTADELDKQTADSGLAPQQAENPAAQAGMAAGAVAPTAASAGTQPQDGGGLLSKMFPGMKKFTGGGRADRINKRVQDTTGMTQAEIDQIDKGYTPPVVNKGNVHYKPNPTVPDAKNIIEAKQIYDFAAKELQANPDDPKAQQKYAQAEQLYKSTVEGATMQSGLDARAQGNGLGTVDVAIKQPDGTWKVGIAQQNLDGTFSDENGKIIQARSRTPDEIKKADEITQRLGDEAVKLNQSASNLAQAYIAYGNARKIIENQPDVIQERTAGITKWASDLGADFSAAGDLVNQILAAPETVGEDPGVGEELKNIEAKLNEVASNPGVAEAQRLAANKGLYDVQLAAAAYYIAAANNQTGKNLSKEELQNWRDLPNNAKDLQSFDKLVGSLLVPLKTGIEKQSKLLPQNFPDLKDFKERYHYSPVEELTNIDQYLEGTPGADLDRVLPKDHFYVEKAQEGAQTPPPSGQATVAAPAGWTHVRSDDQYDYFRGPNGEPGKMKKQP